MLSVQVGHGDFETTPRYAGYAPGPHGAAVIDSAFGGAGQDSDPAVRIRCAWWSGARCERLTAYEGDPGQA
jgi:hypothetical protein